MVGALCLIYIASFTFLLCQLDLQVSTEEHIYVIFLPKMALTSGAKYAGINPQQFSTVHLVFKYPVGTYKELNSCCNKC